MTSSTFLIHQVPHMLLQQSPAVTILFLYEVVVQILSRCILPLFFLLLNKLTHTIFNSLTRLQKLKWKFELFKVFIKILQSDDTLSFADNSASSPVSIFCIPQRCLTDSSDSEPSRCTCKSVRQFSFSIHSILLIFKKTPSNIIISYIHFLHFKLHSVYLQH